MAWQWFQRLWRPYLRVEQLGALALAGPRRVEIEGRVDALETLLDPLDGERCVLIEYRAWPPSTTIGIDGATSHNSRAFQVNARQAVDFVLHDDGGEVLVQVDAGEDVGELHRGLLQRYGVDLRAEVERVEAGRRLCVEGRVVHRRGRKGAPHRDLPYGAIVKAERMRLV